MAALDLDLFLDQKWMSVMSLQTTGRIMSTCKSCHSFFFTHLFNLLCFIHIPNTVSKLEAAPLFLLITWVMLAAINTQPLPENQSSILISQPKNFLSYAGC